jgi:hypothetical protein
LAALLWVLVADEAGDPAAGSSGPPNPASSAGPTPGSSRAEAPRPATSLEVPQASSELASSPTPAPSLGATTGGHQATLEVEVYGAPSAHVDLLWTTLDAEGRQETRSRQARTGRDSLATLEVSWRGVASCRVQVRVNDERGRRAYLELPLEAGARERVRLELPLTPILDVRKPVSEVASISGTIQLYVRGERVESPGLFKAGGDRAVCSPGITGACTVVVRVRLYEENGDLAGWLYGEQEVRLEPGVRTLVDPNYVALASLEVRVLRPGGAPLSAAQVALRCKEPADHECGAAHQADAVGRGGGFGFADEEEEEEEEEEVPDPAPLLGSYLAGERVFLRPGTWEIEASGNDPSLARGSARIVLEPGARRSLDLRLSKGHQVEVRLPHPPRSEGPEVVVEGPPGASAALDASGLLTVQGLLKSDSIRVTARAWVEDERWGQQVLLRAGDRHDLRLVQAGTLELRLRRPDGSPSDAEWRVHPKTPRDLGRYRVVVEGEEASPSSWFKGEKEGHFGPVSYELISSVLDTEDAEDGVSRLSLLPGEHWVEHRSSSGWVRAPVVIRSRQTTRLERVVETGE